MNKNLDDSDNSKIARILRDSFFGSPIKEDAWQICGSGYLNDLNSVITSLNKNGYDIVKVSNKKEK